MKWKRNIIDTGAFDRLPQPEEGYELDQAVIGRDGIIYGIVGMDEGVIMLSRDHTTRKIALMVNQDYIRPGDVDHPRNYLYKRLKIN